MRLRRRLWAAAAALTLMALPAVTGVLPGAGAAIARADEPTVSVSNMRAGWDSSETAMSPSQVKGFTQLFKRYVNGQVYGQPLVIGSTVIVATEKDWVYGLDAATGAIKWSRSLGNPYLIPNCKSNIGPDIGVTAAPVYDPATGDVYVMAQIKPKKTPLYSLFGIDPATGKITSSTGVPLHPANDSKLTFNGAKQLARPGLMVLDGWVYAAFGSHCDYTPYVGYVAGFNPATHARTMWADETKSASDQAGIWQSGAGLMSDGTGRIFFASGNGVSPPPGPGTKPPGELGDSVVRLGLNAAGALSAKDFFSPNNAPALDAADTDWGAGGPVGLPLGTASYPNVLAQVGKDGRIFLLNRDNLGGRNAKNNNTALSVTSPYSGEWGHPAAFASTAQLTSANAGSASDYLYYIGRSDNLRFLKFGVNGADKPTLSDIGNTTVRFGYSSGSPAVTSNGTDPASAVVWAVYMSGPSGTKGALEAFPATPSAAGWPVKNGAPCTTGCTVPPLNSWPIGIATKFSNVATSGNRAYVGTVTGMTSSGGTVYGFGAAPAAAPVAPVTQATFSQTPVHSAATRNVTLTATKTVTVTGVSAATGAVGSPPPPGAPVPSQFTVSSGKAASSTIRTPAPTPAGSTPSPLGTATPSPSVSPARFPVTLHKGDKLTVPVTFTPTAPGGATGTVTFATSAGPQQVAVAGVGTGTGLYASQQSVPFALISDTGQFVSNVPVGVQVPREFQIINGSTQPVTITGITPPAGPYTVTGAPRAGSVLQPGQSAVIQVFFAPTAPGNYPSSFSVHGSDGSTATVSLTGIGLPPNVLFRAAPAAVNFGPVPVGKQAQRVITLTNSGNEPVTILGSSTLTGPFRRTTKLPPQLQVNMGSDVRAPVAFTPRRKGTFTTTYTVTWSDVTGQHSLSLKITGTGT
jgi:hypothetical protein